MTDLPIREELRGIQPYGAPQLDVPIRLNVNENPYPPSEALAADAAKAVADAVAGLNRYPDREALDLRADLATYLAGESGVDLTPEQVWAANGSNEIMLQILQAFGGPGRRVLSFAPTYSMYPEYARNTATEWVTAPRREDFTVDVDDALAAVVEHRPSVVFVASPNNPTGTAVSLDLVRALHDASPGMLVVDEAYAEFRRAGTPSALSLLAECPRLIVTRTMSKAFAFAGARVGYAAASTEVVDVLRVVRLPYHLSAVTQAVARVALAHAAELQERVEQLRSTRDELAESLRSLGLQVPDSDANFVLFGPFDDRHAIFRALLEHGVLVRETGPEGWLRACVGTPEETETFVRALRKVLAREPGEDTGT
ncbi:histidinol-phosphate transaminase [Actinobacteria bacterium YIM 96077]|uniref:Histidinol-phosphate aminotransferase n=1 Tax=Phytoactinopolyspora halophila TaxID=1981511 RepID=A0A329QYE5_9ACTN|nr:histidinol-phosphate transaminase [Phytoactinopolyspora halophila]AYY12865.1 histidinol-phosphate transaminase [Actinobacteria bacterium YIM 96077]RAW16342.1 histidinol-phosphate transaminase [Phytoactinopolyspora halophila]